MAELHIKLRRSDFRSSLSQCEQSLTAQARKNHVGADAMKFPASRSAPSKCFIRLTTETHKSIGSTSQFPW